MRHSEELNILLIKGSTKSCTSDPMVMWTFFLLLLGMIKDPGHHTENKHESKNKEETQQLEM